MKLQEILIMNHEQQLNFTSAKNYEMLSLMQQEEPNETCSIILPTKGVCTFGNMGSSILQTEKLYGSSINPAMTLFHPQYQPTN